jgi:hypothetical protein
LTAEPLVLGPQVADLSLKGLAVGTPHRFHAGIIRSSGTYSRAGGRRGTAPFELGALIKYQERCLPTRAVMAVSHGSTSPVTTPAAEAGHSGSWRR